VCKKCCKEKKGEKMQKILIVEDDKKLRNELEKFLNNNGYEAEGLKSYDNCIHDILQSNSDLILLDINLPFSDGEYICKEVRKSSDVPIIMITSRNNEMDELISINYGADDYITKPYNIQILLARIASILKRTNKSELEKSKIDCIQFVLNISESKIEKDNKQIELTKNESKILQYLVKNRNKIVSREELMDYLWNTDEFVDDNTLTVNITRVRNKLEEIGIKEMLETKRGQGYILK
jgi:DNA-binding response OmpR family regulator